MTEMSGLTSDLFHVFPQENTANLLETQTECL